MVTYLKNILFQDILLDTESSDRLSPLTPAEKTKVRVLKCITSFNQLHDYLSEILCIFNNIVDLGPFSLNWTNKIEDSVETIQPYDWLECLQILIRMTVICIIS